MHILYAHNFYRQAGGEDETFADEIRLMRARGHDVSSFETSSRVLDGRSKLAAGIEGVWSLRAARAVADRVCVERPDVVHFHNTYPVMSPTVFRAAAAGGAGVVHTLHNFRHLCSHAGLYHDGHPCEACVGAFAPWRGMLLGCNHNGRYADAQIALSIAVHRLFGTWSGSIHRYVALTTFARDIFVRGGLPAARMAVLPTFVDPDPGAGPGDGGFALFIGRFTVEKGLRVLLDAWKRVGETLPLKIVGSGGQMADEVAAGAASIPGVEFKGRVSRDELNALVGRAAVLAFPSTWYEGTPRTIAEAFAAGTPVVASDIGAMRTMVEPGYNGAWFRAGDADDLAHTMLRLATDRETLRGLRPGARQTFETTYSAERHYEGLMSIYEKAIATRAASAAPVQHAAGKVRP